MLRGFIVVITALMAITFLGRKQYIHHWFSMFTITAGVALVGYVSIMNSKSSSHQEASSETSVLGIALIVIAMCFMGGMLVVEEKFMSGTNLDPFFIVGIEGLWGLIFFGILLPIFQQIKCQGQLCPTGRLEDSISALHEIQQS